MLLNYNSYLSDLKRLSLAFAGKPMLNYFNILFNYYLSRLTGRVKTSAMPFAFSAEVSAVCNLHCPECIVGLGRTKRGKQFMDNNLFEKLLQETFRKSFYVNLYFQGEPFLNKQLFDLVGKAKEKKFYTVISTNGHFLGSGNNERIINSGLDRLVVSVDGISEEAYTYYRKSGRFEKVINGLKELMRERKKMNKNHPFVVLQFLAHRKNEHEIKYLKSFARQIGVDSLQIKTMQFIKPGNIDDLSPSEEKHRRYQKNEKGAWLVKKKKSLCFRLWSQAVVTSDGDVVPCCYDKIPENITGSIVHQNIGKIWKNERFNDLRSRLLSGKNLPEMCNNCIG